MLRNRKGQTGAWEGLIILVLIIALGGIFYFLLTKDTQTNRFDKGANQVLVQPRPSGLMSFGGCVYIKPNGEPLDVRSKNINSVSR